MYEGECPQGGRQYKEVVPTECRGRGDYQREFTILQQSVRPICPCFFFYDQVHPATTKWRQSFVKPWPNGRASRRKFAKPELAYGLEGWPDGFASRLASRKKQYISHISLVSSLL